MTALTAAELNRTCLGAHIEVLAPSGPNDVLVRGILQRLELTEDEVVVAVLNDQGRVGRWWLPLDRPVTVRPKVVPDAQS